MLAEAKCSRRLRGARAACRCWRSTVVRGPHKTSGRACTRWGRPSWRCSRCRQSAARSCAPAGWACSRRHLPTARLSSACSAPTSTPRQPPSIPPGGKCLYRSQVNQSHLYIASVAHAFFMLVLLVPMRIALHDRVATPLYWSKVY